MNCENLLPYYIWNLRGNEDFDQWREVAKLFLRTKRLVGHLESEYYGNDDTEAQVILFLFTNCRTSVQRRLTLDSRTSAKSLWRQLHVLYGTEREYRELPPVHNHSVSPRSIYSD